MYAIPTGNEHYKPTILSVSHKTSELKTVKFWNNPGKKLIACMLNFIA